MAITSHEVIDGPVSGTRQDFTYNFYLNADLVYTARKRLPVGTDTNADALGMYDSVWMLLGSNELDAAYSKVENRQNPDQVAVFNTQVDFDRLVLAYIMGVEDPHKVDACLPFWSAMQTRNGNNANQRADNLGVPLAEYSLCADRLNNTIGASSFLTNDLASVWNKLPSGAWEL